MADVLRPWQADESLSELTLYADWDSVTSMILSLRLHAFEHGTVPIWNFMLCGGQAELAQPFSWAWTWPSLFAYALPPNHAVLTVWILLTAVGFAATSALLWRSTRSRSGAAIGASVYALCGIFAARFNAGHVTFAFFHLLPVLMLVFESMFERLLAGRPVAGRTALAVLASFAFMTAALPHGLIHFYPAFALLVAARTVSAAVEFGLRRALRAASVAIAANGIGLWLAAYKLWPAIRWQIAAPREGVRPEAYDLGQVLASTWSFVPHYFGPPHHQSWHVFSSWEYNAFVGPLPWALAAFALLGLRGRASRDRTSIVVGCLLVVTGVALCLGNEGVWRPGAWLTGWPVFEAVRAFSRFQILVVFGLALLSAHAVATVDARLSGAARRWVLAGIGIATIAPLVAQTGALVWNLHSEPNAAILAQYAVPAGDAPLFVRDRGRRLRRPRHETALLGAGYWIASCSTDLELPGPEPYLREGWGTLSIPPPAAVEALSASRLALRYPSETQGRVALNLRRPAGFRLDIPELRVRGRSTFDAADLKEDVVEITIAHPDPRSGACASAVGLFAAALFVWQMRRSDRRR